MLQRLIQRRRQRRERLWLIDHIGVPGIHLLPKVNADPNVLPPSAAITAPPAKES